jgi:uncharacterized protein YjbI with pentapeptide repeats
MEELHKKELQQYVQLHRFWLSNDRRGKRADLTLRTLRNLDLSGVDLSRAKLTGAQFINCNLDGAVLAEADLFGVNLSGASFRKADCRRADFRGAILAAADFTEAKLMGCDFRDGTLLVSVAGTIGPAPSQADARGDYSTRMTRADMAGAKLHHAVIKRTDMSAAVLRNADLSSANLAGSSLKDADLRGANMTNCDLSRVMLNRAVLDGAQLNGAVLRDTNVFRVDFKKALHQNLDLRETFAVDDSEEAAAAIAEQVRLHEIWVETSGEKGVRADFSSRDLSGVDFSNRDLTGVVFAHARLRATRFDKARLSLSNLSRIDATGACFMGADLRGTDLTGAVLRRADFREADLRVQSAILPDGSTRDWPVRISFAKLMETDLTNALVDRMLMEGVDLSGIKADPVTIKKLLELPG